MQTSRIPQDTATGRCREDMDDAAIVSAYREGRHATCFQLLYDRYAAKIYSKAMTMLHRRDEAEDATQEIFTKVFLNIGKFEGQGKFSTWVYSITYNMCVDRIRRGRRGLELFANTADPQSLTERIAEDEADEQLLLSMQVGELRRVLRRLSESERMLLLMKYKDGLKIKTIAGIFDKNESAIKMALKRAREKARRLHDQTTAPSL